MKQILYLGYGSLATDLSQKLSGRFKQVGLSRSNKNSQWLHDFVQLDASQDFESQLSTRANELLVASDIIIITLTPTEMSDAAYKKSYVDSTKHFKCWYQSNELSSPVLYISSTRVYAQNNGEWIDENSETAPTEPRAKLLLEAEQNIIHAGPNSHILRFSGIYGGHRNRLIQSISKGVSIDNSIKRFTNRIHQDDCVGIMAFLAEQLFANKNLETIYIGSDSEPTEYNKVITYIADQYGLPKPITPSVESSANILGKRISNKKILKLGYKFKYPSFKDGYRKEKEVGNTN